MKVKWQSDATNMELVIPKGQYLPYELPVATKEVLGGVKVDGDTINITSDGVISAQKVDLSGVATKVELEEVENKIPDTSGLATKNELATVESKIPDTSGLATKTELTAVENKIPDVSGFATKAELPTEYVKSVNSANNALTFTTSSENTVEYKPIFYVNATMAGLAYRHTSDLKNYYIEGLTPITADATYVEIKNALVDGQIVQLKMTDASHNQFWIMASDYSREENTNKIWFSGQGYYLDSHPWTFYATVNESNEWSFKGYDIYVLAVADSKEWVKQQAFATQASLSNVEAKIPDISGLATKVELQTVEGSIPSEYLKNASVADNKLTITKSSGDTIEFSGGSSGGGGSSGSSIPVYSFTSGQELTAEEKGQLDIIKNNPKSVIVYIDGLKANNIYSVSNTIAFTVGGDANIDVKIYTNTEYASYKPQHGGLYLYSFYNTTMYDSVLGENVKVNNTKIKKVRSGDFIVTDINSSGSYASLDKDFIVDWIHNPNQYNVTVDNKPVIYVNNDSNSTSVEVYTLTPGYGGITLAGTSFNFSDNKKLAFDSNRTQYYAMAGTTLLDSQNWQNYISLAGQSSWTYTNSTSDSSLYNATELIIYWHKDYQKYYCNYYKFDQDNYSTLGGNYQWQTFNAYDHSDGGTSSWHYDGSNINTSNMDILGLYYKT